MSETKTLNPEELQQIKELRERFNNVYTNLGIIQSRIAVLEADRNEIYGAVDELRTKENEIFKTLREKYGEGTIDIVSGLFTKEG
jgi:uncharacterized coiled-coil DUF342 family protein